MTEVHWPSDGSVWPKGRGQGPEPEPGSATLYWRVGGVRQGTAPAGGSPAFQLVMKVDVVLEKNMLQVYLLSGFGGLMLLLLIFLALYKV